MKYHLLIYFAFIFLVKASNLVDLLSGNLLTNENHLDTLLTPRVSGTQSNKEVADYILNHFKSLNWHTHIDSFSANTPHGSKDFNNLVFTHNRLSPYTLSIAAHYDSKFFENFDFVGATDSAFPCSLLLDLADYFTPLLSSLDSSLSLQFIFFDGEEAFVNWSNDDSIYGAKHYAETLDSEYVDRQESSIHPRKLKPLPTQLDRIDHLVLLDLLGANNPSIPNYFSTTKWLHDRLIDIEKRVNEFAKSDTLNNFQSNFFKNTTSRSGVSDDHLPFLHRGVPILHIIPSPFPSVWHKAEDDRDALDIPTMERWNGIMRVFIAEYLQL